MRRIWSLSFIGLLLIAKHASAQNTFPSSGAVGIGTTTPASGFLLDVAGDTLLSGDLQLGSASGSYWTLTTGGSILNFEDTSGTNILSLCEAASCVGRVGIGTQNPQAGLDVELITNPTEGGPTMGLRVYNTVTGGSTTDYPQNHLQTSYTGSDPQSNLYGSANSVIQAGTGTLSNAYAGNFKVYNNSSTGVITNGYGFYIDSPQGGGHITNAYGLRLNSQMVTGVTNGYGVYQTGATDINYFAGKVGIGTASPGAALEINGIVKLTSGSGASITFQDGTSQSTAYTGVTCGGDYAESVDATGKRSVYEPGDVLVIASDENGDVAKSSEAYSTAVVGIYSTKPGTLGRRKTTPKSPSELPMAMIGIVPTKVNAENGPIHRGDLLVTSSTPGYAMRGTDRSRMLGAVIGKSLGNLESGEGVIEVVVTLQ